MCLENITARVASVGYVRLSSSGPVWHRCVLPRRDDVVRTRQLHPRVAAPCRVSSGDSRSSRRAVPVQFLVQGAFAECVCKGKTPQTDQTCNRATRGDEPARARARVRARVRATARSGEPPLPIATRVRASSALELPPGYRGVTLATGPELRASPYRECALCSIGPGAVHGKTKPP